MTIQEIRKRKAELDSDLRNLIVMFNEETSAQVKEVIINFSFVCNPSTAPFRVSTIVKIPGLNDES